MTYLNANTKKTRFHKKQDFVRLQNICTLILSDFVDWVNVYFIVWLGFITAMENAEWNDLMLSLTSSSLESYPKKEKLCADKLLSSFSHKSAKLLLLTDRFGTSLLMEAARSGRRNCIQNMIQNYPDQTSIVSASCLHLPLDNLFYPLT